MKCIKIFVCNYEFMNIDFFLPNIIQMLIRSEKCLKTKCKKATIFVNTYFTKYSSY